ncbi:MAG: phosphoribosylglycinamide formyltransferase [Coleofasciculus sp. C3-bin4]|nr:phosphoribosylglycinamide formyltransferase [Coleofasciculus sp. C3-bin4]
MNTNPVPVDASPSLISPAVSTVKAQEIVPLPPGEPLKLGIMASGNGSNFEAIAVAIASQQLNARIQVLIYNNPGIKAVARAEKWGVPAVLLNHRDYKRREDLDSAIVETLRQYEVKWLVMAGWMRVVTSVLIDAFPDRIINIHPSLLPSFKGVRAVEQALAAGVKIAGCTVHLVRPEVDSGPILIQAAVPVLPDDTPETLQARIQVQEHRILPQAIALAAQ